MAVTKPGARSCLECPSHLNPMEAAAVLGKSVSAPMCARFGLVLGRPGATEKENRHTAAFRAKDCESYGDARPTAAPSKLSLEVAFPDMDARTDVLGDMDPSKTIVKTCAQCANYISGEVVNAKYGWTTGMCAAKGRLILDNRKAKEASGCEFRRVGPQQTSVNLPLLPALNDPTIKVIDPVGAFIRGEDSIVEPLDYESDREVTDEEREQGIQAWRRIEDPEGTGNFVMLPVFDPKCLSEEEQAMVPQTGDDEHPELYFDHNGAVYRIAVLWLELDETPAAWGQPGVGKTEVGRHLAWLMQVPFYRFSIKESTEVAELEGSKEFSPEAGTYFKYGRLAKAWTRKAVIVVDEPNMGRPEVWAFIRPLTDNSKALTVDANEGETLPRNNFAFPVLAMNPAWSPLNVGTSPIGAADASRLMHLFFDFPEESVERGIIKNRVKLDGWEIDRDRLDLVFKVSNKVRELVADGTLSLTWGIRENIKAARALRWFDPVTAYRMAAGDYLEPQQQQVLLDQVRAEVGASGLKPISTTTKEF